MPTAGTNPIRFEYLDGVRGVAALVVVFNHFKNAFFYEPENGAISSAFWMKFDLFFLTGEFSVQLFFVLSGFILAYNSFTRKSFLKKQFLKRGYRLFVPVFISSLLYYFFSQNNLFWFRQLSAYHTSPWITEHWTRVYNIFTFVKYFFYDFIFFIDWTFILNTNSSLWTIPIEFYWSYVLFIIFFLIKFTKTKILSNLLLCSSILFVIRFAPFKGVVYGLLFLFGALLGYNYEAVLKIFTKPLKIILLGLLLLLIVAIEKKWLPNTDNTPFRWSYLVALLMINSVLVIRPLQNFFNTKLITWLGRISYSLYLLHLLVIGSLGAWIFVSVPSLRHDMGLMTLLAIVLVVIFIISYLFAIYVDEPMMNLFDRLYNRVKNKFFTKGTNSLTKG